MQTLYKASQEEAPEEADFAWPCYTGACSIIATPHSTHSFDRAIMMAWKTPRLFVSVSACTHPVHTCCRACLRRSPWRPGSRCQCPHADMLAHVAAGSGMRAGIRRGLVLPGFT